MASLQVKRFACLHDNYGFLAHDPATGETAAIDTPDPEAYRAAAADAGWTITQIWNTHHHADHAGGNLALKEATGARIVGAGHDAHRLPGIDVKVADGDTVALGERTAVVIDTPGHTLGHIAYHFAADKVAFVGDTLFALGCGRLFEGDPETMWTSLSRLAALPDDTAVYCAHEYTLANAEFAVTVDPNNPALAARFAQVEAARARGEPTVPTSIGAEKAANPFLRADTAGVREAVGLASAKPWEVFAEVRRRKDAF